MANERRETQPKETQSQPQPQQTQGEPAALERSQSGSLPTRPERFGTTGPFSLMRRFSEDMDRLFDSVFGSRGSRLAAWDDRFPSLGSQASWWPNIEVFERGNKLVIRADLPGLSKEDVTVEAVDDELRISGERKQESEREEGRSYVQERSYGRFYRSIALPEGAKLDSASATFENGVLTVEVEAPSAKQGRGRRIDVREGSPH